MRRRLCFSMTVLCSLVMSATPARAAAGNLDATFGSGGKVITNFGKGADAARDVAIQTDGKIVAAGGASLTAREGVFALARYNRDGPWTPPSTATAR